MVQRLIQVEMVSLFGILYRATRLLSTPATWRQIRIMHDAGRYSAGFFDYLRKTGIEGPLGEDFFLLKKEGLRISGRGAGKAIAADPNVRRA